MVAGVGGEAFGFGRSFLITKDSRCQHALRPNGLLTFMELKSVEVPGCQLGPNRATCIRWKTPLIQEVGDSNLSSYPEQ